MILFTADWHLKLGQKNVPKAWAVSRYNKLFNEINSLKVDLHIIGGDLFDRLPTLEELELYFKFVSSVSTKTIIYDGNHEASRKNHTFFSALKEVTNKINPLVEIVDSTYSEEEFSILPYCDLHKEGSIEKIKTPVLFTHVRGEIPPHVKPEVELERFDKFKIVFAGDLHAHSNSQRNIVYPGSPVTTSFHRTRVDTGYLLIQDDWGWEWKSWDMPQLIRKTISDPKDMIAGTVDHIIYELEGDLGDLATVQSNALLDKKVVKRSNEASLILSKEMGIREELSEYLKYILEIPDSKIPDIIGLLNDYIKNLDME